MREVSVPPRAQIGGLRPLQLRPVATAHGEGEAALGELDAALVENEAVGAVVVDDLRKKIQGN